MEPLGIEIAERVTLPDWIVRRAIRTRVRRRLRLAAHGGVEAQSERLRALIEDARGGSIAVETEAANRQHYEVPADFFGLCLGPHRKYSCALWEPGVHDLAAAEEAMLALYATRAQLRDGQRILDLGCGWGSLALWMAERYPASEIVGVSNSSSQRDYIETEARRRGITNLRIVTADANTFVPEGSFDRILSVEMLEHVQNHHAMLGRIAGWLRPDGRLFIHVFTHRYLAFRFDGTHRSDWIGRHFFTGGMMPSDDLLPRVAEDLTLCDHWHVSGEHYAKTARAWCDRLDANRGAAREVLATQIGARAARRQFRRWRLFFLSCEGLWAYDDGNEFIVSHYLFRPNASSAS